MKRSRKRKKKLLLPLLLGGGAALAAYFLFSGNTSDGMITISPEAEARRKANRKFNQYRKQILTSRPGDVVTDPTGEEIIVTEPMIQAAAAVQGRG